MLENLKPRKVFYYFEEICKIPHGSGNTKAISDYIVSVAKEHHLEYVQDDVNNVIIYKNGSKGFENAEPIMLQGHMDMVCEKNFETNAKFDFEKDSLKIEIMDEYIHANGTTLGGDDGIGVAYMLAILTDDNLVAPPLECVFTVDEEVGMEGAKALDYSLLKSKKLINLDQEEEGIILTSCAGGRKAILSLPVSREEKTGIKFNIVICGLIGGHSGTEIDKYRGNANLFMGRVLHFLDNKISYDLISLNGGLQDNAIPRECNAEILVAEKDVDKLEGYFAEIENTLRNEYHTVEKNMMIYCENEGESSEKIIEKESAKRILFLLMTLPDGVQRMSPNVENLVQTSSNVGIVKLSKEKFDVYISIRSSITSEKEALATKIKFLVETIGGSYKEEGDYPAWEHRENSLLRDATIETYRRVYNSDPQVMGIHAGLETGLFYQNIKDIDIISMGPQLYDIHTPKERLSVPSVGRVYSHILELLRSQVES